MVYVGVPITFRFIGKSYEETGRVGSSSENRCCSPTIRN